MITSTCALAWPVSPTYPTAIATRVTTMRRATRRWEVQAGAMSYRRPVRPAAASTAPWESVWVGSLTIAHDGPLGPSGAVVDPSTTKSCGM